jgi:hypothetical protein
VDEVPFLMQVSPAPVHDLATRIQCVSQAVSAEMLAESIEPLGRVTFAAHRGR